MSKSSVKSDSDSTIKSKRIAKNTLLLYCRTFFTMCISLYTSRVILESLGIDNFGIYNVVGGFVAMFSIISGSLSSSISRFITFGIGKGDLKKLRNIFSTAVNVQFILSLLIVAIGETVGLWYLNSEMNLPAHRLIAAKWVLQCSLFTFVLNLFTTPYSACIIAHEKMSVYAYMSILEVSFKLVFVYYLFITPFDKLITYAVCISVIALIMQLIYISYSKRHFEECYYKFSYDKKTLKEMTGFAWWSFLGNTAYIFNTQGVNLAVNSFFGVVFNASRGIVGQIEGAVMTLINNFTTAFTPQITKSYAEGNKDYMFSLMCRGAKFSFFLLLFLLIPLEICADSILHLWLGVVPDKTSLFLRLSLFCTGLMLIGNPYLTGIMATGNIKNYEIVITIVGCLVFPVTLLSYYLGAPVEISYIIYFVIYSILTWIRIIYARKLLEFPVSRFTFEVVFPIFSTTLLSFIIPLMISSAFTNHLVKIITVTSISIITTFVSIYAIGLNKTERIYVKEKTKSIINKTKLTFSKL